MHNLLLLSIGLKALQALPGPPILAENVLVLEDARKC